MKRLFQTIIDLLVMLKVSDEQKIQAFCSPDVSGMFQMSVLFHPATEPGPTIGRIMHIDIVEDENTNNDIVRVVIDSGASLGGSVKIVDMPSNGRRA